MGFFSGYSKVGFVENYGLRVDFLNSLKSQPNNACPAKIEFMPYDLLFVSIFNPLIDDIYFIDLYHVKIFSEKSELYKRSVNLLLSFK